MLLREGRYFFWLPSPEQCQQPAMRMMGEWEEFEKSSLDGWWLQGFLSGRNPFLPLAKIWVDVELAVLPASSLSMPLAGQSYQGLMVADHLISWSTGADLLHWILATMSGKTSSVDMRSPIEGLGLSSRRPLTAHMELLNGVVSFSSMVYHGVVSILEHLFLMSLPRIGVAY